MKGKRINVCTSTDIELKVVYDSQTYEMLKKAISLPFLLLFLTLFIL